MFYVYADGKLIYHPLDESLVITAPRLTLERGKAGSFQFDLPPGNKFYNTLQKMKTKITVEIDDTEVFRGRILSETQNIYNVCTIYCEGDLAYLVDSVQKGEKYTGTAHDLFRKIVAAHNARVDEDKQFEVGIIGIEDREVILTGQSSEITDADSDSFDYRQIAINSITNDWKTTYDYIESCLIDYCGGYLRTRREGNITYLDLMSDDGDTAKQQMELGVNILDLTEEVSAEELFTVLIPLGDDNLTIESVNNGSDELVDSEMAAIYGRIVKTHVLENVNQPSTLLENGQRFLANHANVPATITIRAVDMHLLDEQIPIIKIGDSVPVKSKPHNITRSLNCTKIEYDFNTLSNSTFTFGTIQQSLTERYRKDKNKSTDDALSSGAKSGGAAGGAAGSAGEEAAKEMGDKIYDAWINVDPETGHVDLGTLYQELKNTKTVLENTCGINIDAPDGNINIYDLKKKYDDQENEILAQNAMIDLLNDDLHAQIELVTSRITTVEGVQSSNYASIMTKVTDLESSISLKAEAVTVGALEGQIEDLEQAKKEAKIEISTLMETTNSLGDRVSKSEATITTLSNDVESKISNVVSRTSGAETKIASLELRVTDVESELEIKADKTTINSKITKINSDIVEINGEISSLNAKFADIDNLIAKKVSTSIANISSLTVDTATIGRLKVSSIIDYCGESLYTNTGMKNYVSNLLASYAKSDHSHAWSAITGKPSSFTPTKHRHSFSASQTLGNGHTHKVTIDGKSYTSAGVSTNANHSVSISGNTGYYPG